MLLIVLLVLVLIFVGLGFLIHLLWIAAVIVFIAWLIRLAFGRKSVRR
jgi:hypothetical protein